MLNNVIRAKFMSVNFMTRRLQTASPQNLWPSSGFKIIDLGVNYRHLLVGVRRANRGTNVD